HGVLLRQAQPGHRLARVEDGAAARVRRGSRDGIDVLAREGRGGREELQEIERGALGREQGTCAAVDLAHRVALAHARTFGVTPVDRRAWIERVHAGVEPFTTAQHRFLAHHHPCTHPLALGSEEGGPVGAADVLVERLAHVALAGFVQGLVLLECKHGIQAAPRWGTKPCAGLEMLEGLRATKSSMRSMQPSAWLRIGSSTRISPRSRSRQSTTPCSAFIAIQGQCAQLLQVAPLPAVGASISSLCGASWRMRSRMPLSVATMKDFASRCITAFSNCDVEPTTSACSTTLLGDSGCTSTSASGCSRRSRSNSRPLNSSWTMHAPFHISMSAPVSSWI